MTWYDSLLFAVISVHISGQGMAYLAVQRPHDAIPCYIHDWIILPLDDSLISVDVRSGNAMFDNDEPT